MGVEANKSLLRRFIAEVVNGGNTALIDELVAADFVDHSAPPGVAPTRQGLKDYLPSLRGAFPDLHNEIDQIIAEGDRIVLLATATGTMRGDLPGMPATNKFATWANVGVMRVADGKIAEHWAVVDRLGMLQQLGVA